MTTSTIERPRSAGPDSGLGGNWRVIVRNDNHNTFEHVAATLARVLPGVNLDQGHRHRRPDPQQRPGDRLDRPARAGRALLGRARARRPDDGAARARVSRAARRLALALLCLGALAPGGAGAARSFPSGFQDTIAIDGLNGPTAVRFAPDGEVFVAQKNGQNPRLRQRRRRHADALRRPAQTGLRQRRSRPARAGGRPAVPGPALRLRALHLRPRARRRRARRLPALGHRRRSTKATPARCPPAPASTPARSAAA